MTEKEKMLRGELYYANDPELRRDGLRAKQLLYEFNMLRPEESELKQKVLRKLLGSLGEGVTVGTRFHCDYGYNIRIGDRVFMNCGCILLDVCEIEIGEDTLLAPNVQIYAATHPQDWKIRKNYGPELGAPVRIANDCWIGGGAIICPGVTIGEKTVIGAGSVVTRDIPAGVLAVGNPCRVVKELS